MRIKALLVLSLCVLLYKCTTPENKTPYNLRVISGNYFSLKVEKYSESTFVILNFISLSCEHCHYQTQALLSDHEMKPTGLRLAFVAGGHPDSLTAFANQFEYDTTYTKFIHDEGDKIAQQMDVTSYPTMFLYDTAGVHLQTIVGEAKPSYVYKFFHDTE
jgi:thioredoxin-related protein